MYDRTFLLPSFANCALSLISSHLSSALLPLSLSFVSPLALASRVSLLSRNLSFSSSFPTSPLPSPLLLFLPSPLLQGATKGNVRAPAEATGGARRRGRPPRHGRREAAAAAAANAPAANAVAAAAAAAAAAGDGDADAAAWDGHAAGNGTAWGDADAAAAAAANAPRPAQRSPEAVSGGERGCAGERGEESVDGPYRVVAAARLCCLSARLLLVGMV